jgi:hypothetical protein
MTQGGRFNGLGLYLKDGKPVFMYNYLGLERTSVSTQKALSPEAVLIFRRDILSVIIIQIRKGRPQNIMGCALICYCCLFDVHGDLLPGKN